MTARLRPLLTVVAVVAVSALSCGSRERYLIPEGYVGPVVVVYREGAGDRKERDEDGTTLYRISNDGMLHIRGEGPQEGSVRADYYYVSTEGQRVLIPWNAESTDVNQVFGGQVGSVSDVKWLSFLVGVPSSRSDWPELRLRFLERALGMEGQLMPEPGPEGPGLDGIEEAR